MEIPFSKFPLMEKYATQKDAAHYISDEDALEGLLQKMALEFILIGVTSNLTEKQRKVVTLRKIGKTFSDIGQVLDISRVAAGNHYRLATKKLHKMVTKVVMGEERE